MANYDINSGAMSGLTGAGTGFAMGGPFGAGLGGLMGLLGGFYSKDKTKKLETMNPDQLRILKQIGMMLDPSGQLGQGYGQSLETMQDYLNPNGEAFNRFADPYMRQFEQQTVPGLAEQFAGLGGGMGGGLSSSGFGQALSSASGNLQSQLAQLKSQLAGSAANSLMEQYGNLSNQILGARPFGYQHIQGGPSAGAHAYGSYAKKWISRNE